MPQPRGYIRVYDNFFSNIFSETAYRINAKFHVEPPWEGRTKVYIHSPGHMIKMAAMPMNGKSFKNLLLQNQKAQYVYISASIKSL